MRPDITLFAIKGIDDGLPLDWGYFDPPLYMITRAIKGWPEGIPTEYVRILITIRDLLTSGI